MKRILLSLVLCLCLTGCEEAKFDADNPVLSLQIMSVGKSEEEQKELAKAAFRICMREFAKDPWDKFQDIRDFINFDHPSPELWAPVDGLTVAEIMEQGQPN